MRAAAVITLLLAIGHSLGSPWTPAGSPEARALVTAMSTYRFDVMGLERSYHDFYVGFGWTLSVYVIGHAVLYWLIAGLATEFPGKARAIVAVFCLEALCVTLLSWAFLFWIPVALNGLVTVCLGLAFFNLLPRPTH